VYDISRVEPRQLASGRFETPTGESYGEITGLRVNYDGSRVALLCAKSMVTEASAQATTSDAKMPDTCIYVYGVDSDRISKFEIEGRRYPVYCWWDNFENRLLAVQTERMRLPPSTEAPSKFALSQCNMW
jgi:hypothetical protein